MSTLPSSNTPSLPSTTTTDFTLYIPRELANDKPVDARFHQLYISFVQSYASSLTGVKGLYNAPIIVKQPQPSPSPAPSTRRAQQIRESIKQEQRLKELKDKWAGFFKVLGEMASLRDWLSRVNHVTMFLKKLDGDGFGEVMLAARWLRLRITWSVWCTGMGNMEVAVMVVEEVKCIVRELMEWVGGEMWKDIRKVMKVLGFDEDLLKRKVFEVSQVQVVGKEHTGKVPKKGTKKAQMMHVERKDIEVKCLSDQDRERAFPRLMFPDSSEPKKKFYVNTSLYAFQLKYMGSLMDHARLAEAQRDERVPFIPDGWQRRLLDIIDRKESALICAPTSSGKTYLAYYAMKQILESNDDDIVVYIAPPKPSLIKLLLKFMRATIGNAEGLFGWLQNAQGSQGIPVHLVKSEHRYASLTKFVYMPDVDDKGLLVKPVKVVAGPKIMPVLEGASVESKRDEKFQHAHPWCWFSEKMVVEGIPMNSRLSAAECYEVYKVVRKCFKDSEWTKKASPEGFFGDRAFLDSKDLLEYEVHLRTVLCGLLKENRDAWEKISQKLRRGLPEKIEELSNKCELDIVEKDFLMESIAPILCDMSEKNMLPAIVFHLDRYRCETFALKLVTFLKDGENRRRETDATFQNRKAESITRREKLEKQLKSMSIKDLESDKAEEIRHELSELFDWEQQDRSFSFAGKKLPPRLGFLVEALGRGIGVHHALPRKYLGAVETLMRSGYLRVVIGTGTMALGINMPCKSTVFAGDSIFLTSLMFQQMSGRAGRRGFDLQGNVVFFGVPLAKIGRLMTAELPAITGHFPLTTTLCLRIFLLASAVDGEGREVIKSRKRMDDEADMDLVDEQGRLIDLAGLVVHLFYTEPANLAFVELYRAGVFHKICVVGQSKETVIRNLASVLCYIFKPLIVRRLPPSGNTRPPRKIMLDPMPDYLYAVLSEHNKHVWRFTAHTHGREGRLNSYLLDFLRHGQIKALERDNRIKPGDSWAMLKDFMLTLNSIVFALERKGDEYLET
ncbi:hypothetical protein BC829DRAFT_419320 [Chytridium lagenaria]|nr:hypothetical protein BC829DRAFT_419320 [Chytridium lagenaria]